MNKVKIYICGDENIGDKEKNTVNAKELKERLSKLRCTVIDPKELPFSKMSWSNTLNNRIEQIKNSNVIYVLPNWKDSIIARIELTVAMDMQLPTIFHPASNKEIKQIITTLDS
jgi:hypothetical protein